MKKLSKIFALSALGVLSLVSCATSQPDEVKYSQQMVESHGLVDFYCNRRHQTSLDAAHWDYVSGLVANAVLKTWEAYPDKEAYYQAVKAFADACTNEDGSFIQNAKGENALRPSNIDDLPAGNIFFALYREETRRGNLKDAERYKTATTMIRNKLKYDHSRIDSSLPGAGGFFHKSVYPNQMWLDGLYMGSPIYAQWQHNFGGADAEDNLESWSDIASQFITIHSFTYNPDLQLNYHAWSATPTEPDSFWANQSEPFKGCSKEFWGRGMGWYIAALVDVLEFMPKDHPDYNAVNRVLQDVAAGLARWQDPQSGVWFQLLQYDGSVAADGIGDTIDGKTYNVGTQHNYLEASSSCIFTYGLLKGIRLGLLEAQTYSPVAEKAYQGILKTFIRENDQNGIDVIQTCASAGLGPRKDHSRTGTINYYLSGEDVTIVENEGKAVGTFILASLEYELAK